MKSGTVTLFDILGWKGIWERNSEAIDQLVTVWEILA